MKSIHDSLRELKEFLGPPSRTGKAMMGSLTGATSQGVFSELNPSHDVGRRSVNNLSNYASMRGGPRALKRLNKPLRTCLARNCRAESTVATEQYFEEQMKNNYNDFLNQRKSKQLDFLDLLQLLLSEGSASVGLKGDVQDPSRAP